MGAGVRLGQKGQSEISANIVDGSRGTRWHSVTQQMNCICGICGQRKLACQIHRMQFGTFHMALVVKMIPAAIHIKVGIWIFFWSTRLIDDIPIFLKFRRLNPRPGSTGRPVPRETAPLGSRGIGLLTTTAWFLGGCPVTSMVMIPSAIATSNHILPIRTAASNERIGTRNLCLSILGNALHCFLDKRWVPCSTDRPRNHSGTLRSRE